MSSAGPLKETGPWRKPRNGKKTVTPCRLVSPCIEAGGIGSAVTNWEVALREDPSLIYVLPYLARGYYDVGRYQAGIDAAERL